MDCLRIASCMAENTESLCQILAEHIEEQLGTAVLYVGGIPWQERERLFDLGAIDILWLCGLPYVHRSDRKAKMEILAAPVPAGERYGRRPIYFSDVVVRSDSRFYSFADLRGASWAYNEPRSHSGFNAVRAYLAGLGESGGFFGVVAQSGAHSASLALVLAGTIDWAAIDSTVLEWSAAQRPGLMDALRVIHTIGPSPIPPLVVSERVEPGVRQALRAILVEMEEDACGGIILERGGLARFVAAFDEDYDPIRRMALRAEQISIDKVFMTKG
jgi:phosphonate transport system substrate-binding protein